MNAILTIVHFLILVNAKLITNKLKEKNVNSDEFKKEIITSKEERHGSSNEYFKFYNKKIDIRSSDDQKLKTNLTKNKGTVRPMAVLVKKPIPKFIDNGSDEDYQAKIKASNKFSDSVEHEDEDFNVDDYDFDVNHDEFAGRGKPLEPRVKLNKNQVKSEVMKSVEHPEQKPKPVLSETKIVLPHNNEKVLIKVVKKAADKMKEEEYDDEFMPSIKTTEKYKKSSSTEIEISDENEDSKEDENKPVRTARSPLSFGTYVDRLGDKTSAVMAKILSYLPMFPISYSSPKKLNEEVILLNEPLVDPLFGRIII